MTSSLPERSLLQLQSYMSSYLNIRKWLKREGTALITIPHDCAPNKLISGKCGSNVADPDSPVGGKLHFRSDLGQGGSRQVN